MKYDRIQKLMPLFRQSRIGYHLAMAAAAAHEENDVRRDRIMDLMKPDEREKAREASNART